MGSGGPPGLQILVSGASGVRGGFDSHAFPPTFALAALWLVLAALAAGPACADLPPGAPGAAPAPGLDSLVTPPAAPVDTAGKLVSVGSTRRIPAATQDTTHHAYSEPRYVMFRSMLVPGWGQLYNRAWLKATLMVGVEGGLIAKIIEDERHLNQLSETADEAQANGDEAAFDAAINAYNDRLSQSISRRWLLGATIAYAMVDAYVDAHFRNFKVEFGPDPALPPDMAPTSGKGKKKSGAGGRMSLRWSF
jgi:hypothetical protein